MVGAVPAHGCARNAVSRQTIRVGTSLTFSLRRITERVASRGVDPFEGRNISAIMIGGEYDPVEDIWLYLKAFHRDDWKTRREEIETRVRVLANKGRDPDKIYAALRAAAFIQRDLRWDRSDKWLLRKRASIHKAVMRALAQTIENLQGWHLITGLDEDDAFDVLKPIQQLRRLQKQFAAVKVPKKFLRNPTAGRPWRHRRTIELFQRAGVPKEERQALLHALGVF
jgi:hypothetical protein